MTRVRVAETRLVWRDMVGEGLESYGKSLNSSARVAEAFAHLADKATEEFWAAGLDAKHRLRFMNHVSTGTLTTSLVHPREVFAPMIVQRAAALIVVHNHPSGDCEPSQEDLAVTERLAEAGKLLGIKLLDHVVIGSDGSNVSIRERIAF